MNGTPMSKAEQEVRERLALNGRNPANKNEGIRVGSDLHLCEMLLGELDAARAKLAAAPLLGTVGRDSLAKTICSDPRCGSGICHSCFSAADRVLSLRPALPAPAGWQREVLEWAVDKFGEVARDPRERAMRFVEEAIELVQTQGVTDHDISKISFRVFSRPAGEVSKEVGQVGMTFEAMAENIGLQVAPLVAAEIERVKSIPKKEWQRRHAAKVAVGAALPAAPKGPPAMTPSIPEQAVLLTELREHERNYASLIHGPLCGRAADEIERLTAAAPLLGTEQDRDALMTDPHLVEIVKSEAQRVARCCQLDAVDAKQVYASMISATLQVVLSLRPALPAERDICIDCDGNGVYPNGIHCQSCDGTGRVCKGDGISAALPAPAEVREAGKREVAAWTERDQYLASNVKLAAAVRKLRAALDGLRPFPLVVERVAAALITEADEALKGEALPAPAMTPAQAFDLGFNWARRLTGQSVEDSRAVGRTLMSEDFAALKLNVDAVPSFKSGDEGIVAAKREIMRALSEALPAPAGWQEIAHRLRKHAEQYQHDADFGYAYDTVFKDGSHANPSAEAARKTALLLNEAADALSVTALAEPKGEVDG